jgi:hypothetical protein
MGMSHIHQLDKGYTFGGQLSEGIPKAVEFNRENGWVVDTEDAGLSDEAVALILADSDFKDVTDAKRVPTNLHQQTFLGMPKSEASDDSDDPDAPLGSDAENKPKDSEPAGGTSITDDTPGTTVGGSTPGPTGKAKVR